MTKEEIYKASDVLNTILDNYLHGGEAAEVITKFEDELIKSNLTKEEPKKCMYSKDNYTDEDRKVLCDGCEEDCKYNKKDTVNNNCLLNEPSIPDIVDEHWWEMLGEEPVSEEAEKAAKYYIPDESYHMIIESKEEGSGENVYDYVQMINMFKVAAKWQKANLWKPADGNKLPEYDREVIAILDYDFGHYKVVYAHRPNPNGWNGTNIDTGEKEHFEPAIYDKGGWNQPHVLYWLDTRLPYEKIKQ